MDQTSPSPVPAAGIAGRAGHAFSPETLRFIEQHRADDVHALALQAKKFPGVDLPAALAQIAGRQAAATKIPTWHARKGILYPPHLSMEQCSSEPAARYKASLVGGATFADLTGGFGIDCAFVGARFGHADYVERQEELCRIARHNFALLGLDATVHCADAVAYLQAMASVDCLLIDPARRDAHGGKTVAIADCEPDVAALEPLLVEKAGVVLVKLSPMLDLALALRTLRAVAEVHVVAVDNECKELLLVLRRTPVAVDEVPVRCVNLTASAPAAVPFTFTLAEERAAACPLAAEVGAYLYEPHAALLKAGAFRSPASRYGVSKLHPNSHLYTSAEAVGFPGRCFRVESVAGFGKRELKAFLAGVGQANLTVRNFPLGVAELRRRLKLREGGDTYLFATTLADGRHVLVKASKLPAAGVHSSRE